jgi:putative photosynthetic complex assembly protein 2
MAFLSAIVVASIAWWVATGLVLALARAGSRHLGAVMALATGVALAGIAGLVATHDQTTVSSAYIAFFSALALWAWHETTFLIGILTGPRRIEAGQAPVETSRFRAAFLTVRDHELALAATVIALIWFMAGAENTTGLLTFMLLWVMRISTKLNIYLGARHAISDMLPDRLSYLKSYFRTDRTSGWFYVSLSASAVLLGWLSHAAATAAPNTTSSNGRCWPVSQRWRCSNICFWCCPFAIPRSGPGPWNARTRRNHRQPGTIRAQISQNRIQKHPAQQRGHDARGTLSDGFQHLLPRAA